MNFSIFFCNLAFMHHIHKIIFFFSFLPGYCQPNDITVKQVETIKTEAKSFIGRDAFGNNYTVSDNIFQKEGNQKKLEYKNVALGSIAQLDLQNLFEFVFFYKAKNAVVLLDNQLKENIRNNFSETNPELLPQLVSLASQNRLWLFDFATQKLGLYDYQKKTFHPISVTFESPIIYSQSDYNFFYWINKELQLLASNVYGKINFLGKVEKADQTQIISSKQILLKKGDTLSIYDLEKETSQIIPIPEKSFQSFYYKEQILSIFTTNEIRNYKIILP